MIKFNIIAMYSTIRIKTVESKLLTPKYSIWPYNLHTFCVRNVHIFTQNLSTSIKISRPLNVIPMVTFVCFDKFVLTAFCVFVECFTIHCLSLPIDFYNVLCIVHFSYVKLSVAAIKSREKIKCVLFKLEICHTRGFQFVVDAAALANLHLSNSNTGTIKGGLQRI